ENIRRHLSYGEPKRTAIVGAVIEGAGAVAASTVCTVAVFAPIAFTGGMVGELFRPFGLTVTIALAASLLVALTIVPVLAYWFVKSPVHIDAADLAWQREQAEAKERKGFWQRIYLPTLAAALRHPVVTLAVAVALLGGTAGLATTLETNFMDNSGQDAITVTQSFESGTSLAVQDEEARPVEQALIGLPEVGVVQTTVGGGGLMGLSFGGASATFAVTVADGTDPVEAEDAIRAAVADLGGSHTTGLTVGSNMMMSSSTVDLVVQATNPESLAQAAGLVEEAVRGVEGATEVSNDLTADQDTVAVNVNRAAAAGAGLTETQVLGLVASLMAPRSIGAIDTADGRVDVQLSMGPGPATVEALRALPLAAGPAGPITLGQLADVTVERTQGAITRTNGEHAATVSVTPAVQDLGGLASRLETAVADLDLPAGATVEVGGVAATMRDAFSDLGLAMLVAIAIVFIVMVATFGSLLQPFILLISIPFAATGALIGLLATGNALGVPALIGLLMLVGIVVSNAIVLIDLINQYRRRGGRSLAEAIAEGARKRLRPILMTALATICALLPMAFGLTGSGSFLAQPLAIVVIGGLVSSTLLTLIVVPVLYRFEARAHDRRTARHEAALARRREERTRQREARLAAEGTP
ncbi:MAG: efflux RND transporter permease subunit, partial [Propionibacteriaceae bacterium]|nr:efflux RND transporter permease subunit [Propionibacteriaceae bacterium]